MNLCTETQELFLDNLDLMFETVQVLLQKPLEVPCLKTLKRNTNKYDHYIEE